MKILVISDLHGWAENVRKAAKRVTDPDYVFDLGDTEGLVNLLDNLFDCPVLHVRGNCDYASPAAELLTPEIDGIRFVLAHGHRTADPFAEAARRNARVICLGHTHKPRIQAENGILLVNPGSLSYPRQDGRVPTYAVLKTEDGCLNANIVEFEEY